MQKQSLSLSIVLTADKIATDYIFKDGEYIDIEEAKQVLIDKNELSDNERCYRYIVDKVAMNPARFDPDNETTEKWGIIEDGYAVIISTVMSDLCKQSGFSRVSFLKWASDKKLISSNEGRTDSLKRFNGTPVRCVKLKLSDNSDFNGGFEQIDMTNNDILPFN